jgi:hypothetical protein
MHINQVVNSPNRNGVSIGIMDQEHGTAPPGFPPSLGTPFPERRNAKFRDINGNNLTTFLLSSILPYSFIPGSDAFHFKIIRVFNILVRGHFRLEVCLSWHIFSITIFQAC